ncbi:hypothetical protein D9757_008376 [Collybiopsis confluens]|uniref:Uncharacterized protein n=1 Tax=Collybiopsis confluens TaxID=2823264 RepID=A0A8H5HHP1_9AGAR|nr:hypothetical protein D9757_008376 [Collybiopsis confluens]
MYPLNTTIDDSSPLITYEGTWNANSPTDPGLHDFNGTAIYIYGGRRSNYGKFIISLDGEESSGSAFNPSVSGTSELLFHKEGMKQGWHTVVITNNGTGAQSGLDIDFVSSSFSLTEVNSLPVHTFKKKFNQPPDAMRCRQDASLRLKKTDLPSLDHLDIRYHNQLVVRNGRFHIHLHIRLSISIPFSSRELFLSTKQPTITYKDEMSQFDWLPHGAWSKDENSGGKKTSMVGAYVQFNFESHPLLPPLPSFSPFSLYVPPRSHPAGQAVSLQGLVGPDCTNSYNVTLDDSPPRTFDASNRISISTTLYYADNLGPGNHTVKICNLGGTGSKTRTVSDDEEIPQVRTRARSHFSRRSRTPSKYYHGMKRRQTSESGVQQQIFGITQAQVWRGNSDVTVSSTTPSIPSPTGTDAPSSTGSLSTGAIVGIATGGVVFMALILLILLLSRRNKTLWIRLQRGYMVQSQSEPHSPTAREGKYDPVSSTPLIRSQGPAPGPDSGLTFFRFPRRKKRPTLDPYPFPDNDESSGSGNTLSGARGTTAIDHARDSQTNAFTHKRERSGSGLYKPYTGFGRSRHHHGQGNMSQGQMNISSMEEYNPSGQGRGRLSLSLPLPGEDPAGIDLGEVTVTPATAERSTPLRTDTAFTASTLVAEDGSEDMALEDKPLKVRITHNPPSLSSSAANSDSELPLQTQTSRRNTTTRSTTTPRTPKSSSALLSGNSHLRFSRTSYPSRFSHSRPSRRTTRSSSPSRTGLLHPDSEVQSDFEEDYDDTADFYARDASGILGSHISPTSIYSVARTQSSARTLARIRVVDDRTEYEDEEADPSIPPLPMTPPWLSALNRNGTRNLTASPASFTRGGGGSVADAAGEVDQMLHHQILGSNPDPNRQTTNDSLPPPAYTSRTPTIDLPPPPPPPPLGIFPPTA